MHAKDCQEERVAKAFFQHCHIHTWITVRCELLPIFHPLNKAKGPTLVLTGEPQGLLLIDLDGLFLNIHRLHLLCKLHKATRRSWKYWSKLTKGPTSLWLIHYNQAHGWQRKRPLRACGAHDKQGPRSIVLKLGEGAEREAVVSYGDWGKRKSLESLKNVTILWAFRLLEWIRL